MDFSRVSTKTYYLVLELGQKLKGRCKSVKKHLRTYLNI